MIVKEYNKTVTLIERLYNQLKAASCGVAVDSVSIDADQPGKLFVHLTREPSGSEATVCDNIVANYSDVLEALKVPKILALAKEEAAEHHLHNIDYTKDLIQTLIPKRTVIKGEVQKVDWYKTMNGTTPEDKVLTVDVAYTRDASGFAVSRTVTRTWINENDESNSDIKTTNKYYFVNPSDQIAEGIRRRDLIVKSIQIPTMTAMMYILLPLGQSQAQVLLQGREFLDDYELEFNKFVHSSSSENDIASPDFGKKNVVIKLENEADAARVAWLDQVPGIFGALTIREYLVGEFSI